MLPQLQPLLRAASTTNVSRPLLQIVAKTPNNNNRVDCLLPRYQHETDLALAVDVAVLWRALDETTPEHASYTLEKASARTLFEPMLRPPMASLHDALW